MRESAVLIELVVYIILPPPPKKKNVFIECLFWLKFVFLCFTVTLSFLHITDRIKFSQNPTSQLTGSHKVPSIGRLGNGFNIESAAMQQETGFFLIQLDLYYSLM